MERNEFVQELIEMTKMGKLVWFSKNPRILSNIVPDGDVFLSIYSSKLNSNSIYICSRKYIEDEVILNGTLFEKHIVDTYKHSIYIFDGVELLYFIDENNHLRDYDSHKIATLNNVVENTLKNKFFDCFLNKE